MTRHALTAALVGFSLAATALVLAPTEVHAEKRVVIDRIVAKVNEDIITLNDLKRASGAHLLARRVSREQLDADPNADKVYREILEDMINTRLLIQEAKELQLEVNEEDVDAWIDNVIRSEQATEEDFRDELRARGVRWRDYRRYIKESLLKVRVVQIKVASRVKITDSEVETAYVNKYGASPGKGIKAVDISHIQIPYPADKNDKQKMADTQALVNRVMTDLDRGKPFAELAKEVSTGPMADNGGHLGKFKPGDLRQEYGVIFDLEPGEYSRPIEVESGFHIFRVNEVFTERDAKVDSRLDELRGKLLGERRNEELKLWLESLRKRAYVKVMY